MIQEVKDIDNIIRTLVDRRRELILRELGMSVNTLDGTVYKKLSSALRKVSRLTKELEDARQQIQDRDQTIAELNQKLEKYMQLAGKLDRPMANTNNSSVPSSKNPLGAPKRTRSLRKPSGKKVGGQPGHEGHTRPITDFPDEQEECQAPTICPKCGSPIDPSTLYDGECRQVVDIPAYVVPLIKEYIQKVGVCKCGHHVKGEFPKEVTGTVCFGKNIKATVAYLSVQQCIPFKRLTEIMENLFGVHMSQGTVANILESMRKKARVPYEKIRQEVAKAQNGGADESGLTVNGARYWLWSFHSLISVYMAAEKHRSQAVVDNHFPGGFPNMALESDRLALYFNIVTRAHQICLAHLLRNTTYYEEYLTGCDWPKRMLSLLGESIHLRKTSPTDHRTEAEYKSRLDKLLDEEIDLGNEEKQKAFDSFRKGLRKHQDHFFTFLAQRDVHYDNNASERSLRMAKTKMKVSGQFKSEEGARIYATLQSIIQTAQLNNQNPWKALLAIAEYEEE